MHCGITDGTATKNNKRVWSCLMWNNQRVWFACCGITFSSASCWNNGGWRERLFLDWFGWCGRCFNSEQPLIRFSFTVKCWCQNQCEWLHRFCKFSTSTFFSHWDTLVRGSQNCSCSLDSLEIQNIVLSRSRTGTDWGTYRWWCRRPRLSLPTFQLQCTLQISLLAENKALHGRFNTWKETIGTCWPKCWSHWRSPTGHWRGWESQGASGSQGAREGKLDTDKDEILLRIVFRRHQDLPHSRLPWWWIL